jgi:hypothetical protein
LTTQVIITMPSPNHKRAKVEQYYRNSEGTEIVNSATILEHGESRSIYIHDSCSLRVTEVD